MAKSYLNIYVQHWVLKQGKNHTILITTHSRSFWCVTGELQGTRFKMIVSRNVFNWQGSAWVGENISGAKTAFLENSGHMLFWEGPEKFKRTVIDFIEEIPG